LRAARLALVAVLFCGCATQKPAPVEDRRARAKEKPQAAPKQQKQNPDEYTVKRGDTLYSIALENGADYRELAAWNGIDDPSKIRVGQVLKVKPPEVQVNKARMPE